MNMRLAKRIYAMLYMRVAQTTAFLRSIPDIVQETIAYNREFGCELARAQFQERFFMERAGYRVGYSDEFIATASEYMIRELSPIIEKYSNKDSFVQYQGKCNFPKKPVWVCWWQGREKMPPIVQVCLNKINKSFDCEKYEVILITEENYKKYIDLPPVILEKLKKGNISIQHFTDVLRWGLMSHYGGVWFDATVLLMYDSVKDIEWELEMPFFTQKFKSEEECPNEPSRGKWCNFYFMGKHCGNITIFQAVYDSIVYYWEKHDIPFHYAWLDYVIWALYIQIPDIRKLIDNVPPTSGDLWRLKLDDKYSVEKMNELMEKSEFYKTTYKTEWKTKTADGSETIYGYLLRESKIPME